MNFNLLTCREHDELTISSGLLALSQDNYENYFAKTHSGKDVSMPCYTFNKDVTETGNYVLKTGYFIGVDWIESKKLGLYVAPKLNAENKEVDFIRMLFASLRHADVAKEVEELFEIKWSEPDIEITQQQDLLTPVLVVEFLSLLKVIVQKGLKMSYYKIQKNLNSRVKGKILVGKSIKHNLLQNKMLKTYCQYDIFGLDNKENRLLKKALKFVKSYLPKYSQLNLNKDLQNTFNFINPAFAKVSGDIDLNEIKDSKTNPFYKEYKTAIRLAKLILKRFGYNLSNTIKDKIKTPPFWIDMSKLFELYSLGLLKDRFKQQVKFQFKVGRGNELDFLLNAEDYKMVVDAKYKTKYEDGIDHKDLRQVSGYARLKKVYEHLGKEQGQVIDCLIIYPDQHHGHEDLMKVELKDNEVNNYYDIYKLAVKLPCLS